MLKDRALFQRVQQLLELEVAEVDKLHDLLAAETLALQTPDPTALVQIIKQKALPLAALEQSQRARYSLLEELQRPADEDSWQNLIKQLDAVSEVAAQSLTALLDGLLKTLASCRSANQVNEKVVCRSQYSVQHLLDIMRGNIPDNKLYSASGNTVSLTDVKPITAA